MSAHRHICACGDWFRCTQPPDHCIVPDPYVCPNCEQQQRDDYMTTHQPITETIPHEHQ